MRDAVVFLPGLMCDARLFGPQIADLSREGPVMVAPPVTGERIEEMASSLLDVLPRRAALVGHGLGAAVAIEILRRAPDRVSRVALMGISPLGETPHEAADRDPQIIRVRSGRLDDVIREQIAAAGLAPRPHRGEIIGLLVEMAAGLGPEVYVRQSRALQRRRDPQSTLGRIAVPALVLCGAHDALYPVERHRLMADLIERAGLEVIEGAGHYPMLESPDEVSDALRDWLAAPAGAR